MRLSVPWTLWDVVPPDTYLPFHELMRWLNGRSSVSNSCIQLRIFRQKIDDIRHRSLNGISILFTAPALPLVKEWVVVGLRIWSPWCHDKSSSFLRKFSLFTGSPDIGHMANYTSWPLLVKELCPSTGSLTLWLTAGMDDLPEALVVLGTTPEISILVLPRLAWHTVSWHVIGLEER